jgi:hypothetical protein
LAIFAAIILASLVELDPGLLRKRMRPGGKQMQKVHAVRDIAAYHAETSLRQSCDHIPAAPRRLPDLAGDHGQMRDQR